MIDPKELRLGNLLCPTVTTNSGIRLPQHVPFKVVAIHAFDVFCAKADDVRASKWINLQYGDMEPIPLTEDWLIKTPFKEVPVDHPVPNHIAFELHGVHVKIYNTGQVAVWYQGQVILPHHIKYVHQLQNLYFALTGQELTIKEV